MNKILMLVALTAASTVLAPTASAQNSQISGTAAVMNEDVGVPVFPYDITDRPYKVLGEVSAGVRKATLFSKEPSQKKIYRELWERGKKLGADAVVKATYGDSHVSAFSWGKTNATGVAIKFLPPGEAAAVPSTTVPTNQ